MEGNTGLQTAESFAGGAGGGAGTFAQTAAYVAGGIATIFGQVGANKYVRDLSINHDDVVAEDIHQDNRTLIYTAITGMLLVGVVIILTRK
jgi:hypothetical protein